MPKYNMTGDDMMDTATSSMYGGSSESAEESESPKESVDQENQEATTAIIANKVLSPDGEAINPGDEIVVRVVKNYGDESEVEYAPKKEGQYDEKEEPETPEEPMDKVRGELTSLSEEGE